MDTTCAAAAVSSARRISRGGSTPGSWYGWPDYVGDRPVDDASLPDVRIGRSRSGCSSKRPGRSRPGPVARLAVHSSSNGLDVSRSEAFGFVGQLFIAQFGDQAPAVGKVWAPVGFKVVKVTCVPADVTDFAANQGKQKGPASRLQRGGLERPVSVRFSPDGRDLYVVDFGVLRMDEAGKSHGAAGNRRSVEDHPSGKAGRPRAPCSPAPRARGPAPRGPSPLHGAAATTATPAADAGLGPRPQQQARPGKPPSSSRSAKAWAPCPASPKQLLPDAALDQLADYVVALRKAD